MKSINVKYLSRRPNEMVVMYDGENGKEAMAVAMPNTNSIGDFSQPNTTWPPTIDISDRPKSVTGATTMASRQVIEDDEPSHEIIFTSLNEASEDADEEGEQNSKNMAMSDRICMIMIIAGICTMLIVALVLLFGESRII
jgi:hypothetical protein